MIKKIIFASIALFVFMFFIEPVMPLVLKQFLYSLSILIKSTIIFVLPLIIFGLLFKTVVGFTNGATKIILGLLVLMCLSNTISVFLSHFVGQTIYNLNFSTLANTNQSNQLEPLFSIEFPTLIPNSLALLFAVILGIVLGKTHQEKAKQLSKVFDNIVQKILSGIMYMIPVFIFGFLVKMCHDGTLTSILKDYSQVLMFIIVSQFAYIFVLYFIMNKFSFKKFLENMKNMFPAAVSGFTTMSSAATMPLTILGVKASTKNKEITTSTIPVTTNIHTIGDCFVITILAYAVLKGFNFPEPSFYQYMMFMMYFVITKFSSAGVPGGAVLVVLPGLEKYFGFNAEMLSLITTLYILFDPIATSGNVLGNGLFAKFLDNIFSLFKKKTPHENTESAQTLPHSQID